MTTLPKGPTNSILVNLQGLFDPIGFTLRMPSCARPKTCAASSIRSSPAAAPSPPSAPIS